MPIFLYFVAENRKRDHFGNGVSTRGLDFISNFKKPTDNHRLSYRDLKVRKKFQKMAKIQRENKKLKFFDIDNGLFNIFNTKIDDLLVHKNENLFESPSNCATS